MAYGRTLHPNAPFTPVGRRRMVTCVLDDGWSVTATAERFQVDPKTVRKWRDRYLAEGVEGLMDRSSRPQRSPNRTRRQLRRRVCRIRKKRRWGADHIAYEVGLATSTVQNILNRAGLGRLDRGDRATDTEPVRRYQRDTPGELIHVDIKKLAGIPDGGGWKTRGRGYKHEKSSKHHGRAGYRYIHTAIDDRSRIAYSEILDDEKGETAARFWERAAAWYVTIGITPERVITDNGGCYRSGDWHKACEATGTTVKKTRPYRPQTNGKVERFHRILLEEWAYIRPWTSDIQRTRAYEGFIHFYNHHRAHGALRWANPHHHHQGQRPRRAHLGRYARDKKVFSLEECVKHPTANAAQRLGLPTRGRLSVGCHGDVVILDPIAVTDRATYDDPKRYPEGIRAVIVNGGVTIRNAKHTGATAGRWIKAGDR